MVIGLDGQSCAGAGVMSVSASASATKKLRMIVSSLFGRDPGLLDDLSPHLDVLLDEGLQILGRAAGGSVHFGARVGHLILAPQPIEPRAGRGMDLPQQSVRRSRCSAKVGPGPAVQ